MKKNVGTRPLPIVRTPEQQRKHRAEQAARAILAGRNVGTNWARIARHLVDGPAVTEYAGLSIPPETLAWLTPVWTPTVVIEPATEPTIEETGVLVIDPIFGEVLEIEMAPLPVIEATV